MKNSLEKVTNDIEKLMIKLESPFKEMLNFIKDHKKLLITIGIIYFVYKYLFSEESKND